MSQGFLTKLNDRALIRIFGRQAESFLQGVISNDVERLEQGRWLYSGLLTPQGKVLFDFFVIRIQDGFLADCSDTRRDELIERLGFYKLRTEVEIEPYDPSMTMVAVWSNDDGAGVRIAENNDLCAPDPRYLPAGLRAVLAVDKIDDFAAKYDLETQSLERYHQHRIALGLPDARDIGAARHFVHECNFDCLNGVSFTKGCYIGQEVVSRVEHKTSARTRMVPVAISGAKPEFGADITVAGKRIGSVLSVAGDFALARLRLDRASAALASGLVLEANGATLSPLRPGWADFEIPGAARED